MGKILVWGDVDITWHYRQSVVDTAGPAKDRSQRQWSGVGTYGLSGLNVRQLALLNGKGLAHGLSFKANLGFEFTPDQAACLNNAVGSSTLSLNGWNRLANKGLEELDTRKQLPIFGYQIDKPTKALGEDERGLVIKEPLGWTACRWAAYRRLTKAQWAKAVARLEGDSPDVVLLNDAGWGCLRSYFDAEEGKQPTKYDTLRNWLNAAGKEWGAHLLDAAFQKSVILVKSRIYPPIDYAEPDASFKPYKTRTKEKPAEIDPKLVVVVNVGDLRLLGANISRGISWERTVQHLLDLAKSNFLQAKQIAGIMEAGFVVVSFGADGIVLIQRGNGPETGPTATLFFHGPVIEGDTETRIPEKPYGATTWISSILSYLLSEEMPADGEWDDWWKDSLRFCLAFVRDLTYRGNKAITDSKEYDFISFGQAHGFPADPTFPGWYEEDINKWVKQFKSWRKYRGLLRAYSTIKKEIISSYESHDVSEKLDKKASQFAKEVQEFRVAEDCNDLNKLVETQRIRYVRVSSEDIDYIQYGGPGGEALERKGWPDKFRQTWWSFLSVELTRRALRERSCELEPDEKTPEGEADPSQLATAAVRYACEVLRYGGWERQEYFPYTISLPYVEYGKLQTCDRAEIEGLRNFAAIVKEYRRRKDQTPLNVAVFGPPGAGKSFGVKEVITSIVGEEGLVFLTFNLSQFQSPAQLPACYQLIQNEVLKGKLPVVFWDEFDATLDDVDFGWLQSFLSPMQDGSFIHEQRENKIGPCVFVFAGSRFERFSDLPEPSDSLEKPRQEVVTLGFREVMERANIEDLTPWTLPPEEVKRVERSNLRRRQELWRIAKGNDFRSRLRGYLDVQGCNIQPNRGEGRLEKLKPKDSRTCDQLNFLVRRARIVRAHLLTNLRELFVQRTYPRVSFIPFDKETGRWQNDLQIEHCSSHYTELKISDEIAFGLLTPYSFVHEVRSIETVLKASELSDKARFERAFLPSGEMLSVHIRPDAFDPPKLEPPKDTAPLTFQDFLQDWWEKYNAILSVKTRLEEPVIEVIPAVVDIGGKDKKFPCLKYLNYVAKKDEKEPDRLEILMSRTSSISRPEKWETVAFDRGSPYLLNAEQYMLDRLGIAPNETKDGLTVYVSCRWWRGQEFGALCPAKPLTLRLVGDLVEFDFTADRQL